MTFNAITRLAILAALIGGAWLSHSIRADNEALCRGDSDCIAHLEQNTH